MSLMSRLGLQLCFVTTTESSGSTSASPLAVYCQTLAWLGVAELTINSERTHTLTHNEVCGNDSRAFYHLLSECGSGAICLFASACAVAAHLHISRANLT